MSHKNKLSLVRQCEIEMNKINRIGFSKHEAKIRGEADKYVYSVSTCRQYLNIWIRFAKYCHENHKCKLLEECLKYVIEWLLLFADCSPSTQKTYLAALRKLYGKNNIDFSTPARHRADIKKGRQETIRSKRFNNEKNHEFIQFCRSTGLRRHEVKMLKGTDLIIQDGKYHVHVRQGKGGKERYSLVIGNIDNVVRLMTKAGDKKVFSKVHSDANIHSFRRDYATSLYTMLERDLSTLPKKEIYCCKKDKCGVHYDKAAMQIVSYNLGHNRINVIAGHYLDFKPDNK